MCTYIHEVTLLERVLSCRKLSPAPLDLLKLQVMSETGNISTFTFNLQPVPFPTRLPNTILGTSSKPAHSSCTFSCVKMFRVWASRLRRCRQEPVLQALIYDMLRIMLETKACRSWLRQLFLLGLLKDCRPGTQVRCNPF